MSSPEQTYFNTNPLLIKYKSKKEFPTIWTILIAVWVLASVITFTILLGILNYQNTDISAMVTTVKDYEQSLKTISSKLQDITLYWDKNKDRSDSLNRQYNESLWYSTKLVNDMSKTEDTHDLIQRELAFVHIIEEESNIFTSLSELKRIIKFIKISLNITSNRNPTVKLVYDARTNGDNGRKLSQVISGLSNWWFVLQGKKREIYGGYIHKEIIEDKMTNDENAFLFNWDVNDMFMIKKGKLPYWFGRDMFFSFGQNDLFIADDFLTNTFSWSYFPTNFGKKSDDPHERNRLTNGNTMWSIRELEIYQIVFDN